jgi:4,5-dihydroxyphthalate decarboxylase
MTLPPLKLGVGDYDTTRALITGEVRSPDFNLQIRAGGQAGHRHRAMLVDRAFDAAEYSLANYLIACAEGQDLCAIPVFPNRAFRHSNIYVNRAAGIQSPRDLEGRRVGMRGWVSTASVWVRGLLQHQHGVDPRRVRWVARPDHLGWNVPAGWDVEPLGAGQSLDALLLAGELDAVVTPEPPPSFRRGAPEVGRLFEDYRAADEAWYRRTGVFPISHLLALDPAFVRAHPQAPLSLLRTFRQARDAAFHRIQEQQILALSWAGVALAEQRALMGDHYWPYNVPDNRAGLELAIAYAHEQGVIARPLAVEDLFLPETLTAPGA